MKVILEEAEWDAHLRLKREFAEKVNEKINEAKDVVLKYQGSPGSRRISLKTVNAICAELDDLKEEIQED